MINPYIIAGGLAALVACYGVGRYDGARLERESRISSEKAAQVAYDAALAATAQQIAGITVTNTTVRQKAEVIVRENIVYRSCVHTPLGLQSINAAITGQSVSDSELPSTDTAN